MVRKQKKKTWASLKEEKCPKCSAVLMNDLFGKGQIGCACGFNIESHVKDILTERDKE